MHAASLSPLQIAQTTPFLNRTIAAVHKEHWLEIFVLNLIGAPTGFESQ